MAASDPVDPSVGAVLEQFVSSLLRWGTRADVRRAMLSAGMDLSPTDEWLLRRIQDVGPVRLSDLASWQAVDKSTMTSQVHRLEERGLVSRATDPHDGRVVLVSLTLAGTRLHDANVTQARHVLDRLVDDWSEVDRAEVARLLDRLARRLEGPIAP